MAKHRCVTHCLLFNFIELFLKNIQTYYYGLSRKQKLGAAFGLLLLLLFIFTLPKKLFNDPTSFVIEDSNGKLLNATIAADGQWRFPNVEKLPKKFISCITTYEDKRFFHHPGVDMVAFGRSLVSNLKAGKITQGGSTLSMQVIRMALQNQRRNIWNKLKETVLALRLEFSYSKNEILQLYAGNAPFGGNVVGLQAAAWRYYGRDAGLLSWGEMATLAVLPNSPALVHPGKNREKLLARRNSLLRQLLASGHIDTAACELAMLEPLPGAPHALPQNAVHLFQRYKKEWKAGAPTYIKTTINGILQQQVASVVEQHHQVLKGNGINNAAALVLDVETGKTLSYVGNIKGDGSREMEADVDIISAPRSPGSALKPILYAAALHDGQILPQSLLPDVPINIGSYTPKNFDLGYDGAVAADWALARSLNLPAVKLLQQYKYPRFYDLLRKGGFTTINRPADTYGLSLILGGCEVTMWDLAAFYASMARVVNHGNKNDGNINAADLFQPVIRVQQQKKYFSNSNNMPLDATSVWFAFQAMKEVMRPGEEGLWQQFNSSQTIAWKTGTSFGFRDGWAIGVTPQFVVAVWAGNADGEGRPGLIGVQTAAPIMFDIFRLLPVSSFFPKPVHNISFVPVCPQSGYRVGLDCPVADTIMVPLNGNKSPLCSYHKRINLDATEMFRVNSNCELPANMKQVSWFVLPPAMEYFYRQKNAHYQSMPRWKQGCSSSDNGKMIDILYPEFDSKIYVPLEVSGERGRTIFKAAHSRTDAKIFWSIDNNFVGETQNFHQLSLNPTPGKHLLTLVDDEGVSLSRPFTILQKED